MDVQTDQEPVGLADPEGTRAEQVPDLLADSVIQARDCEREAAAQAASGIRPFRIR
jgi:hypothetical protein